LRAWFDRIANWEFAAAQYAAVAQGEKTYRYPAPAPLVETVSDDDRRAVARHK
jgi:hypothetical protein